MQAVVNIGMVGHVDHGKTTLTASLTGKWTDTHSEELRRGISIRLGFADTSFYKCPSCERYSTKPKCPYCGSPTEFQRRVSFVDAPGHEMLMATVLSGAMVMDGAILVIAANEPCPQPQTREHLMALQIAGVKNLVVAQNKIELVSEEKALEHYHQIKAFLSKTPYAEAPILPISAIHRANLDKLIETLEREIPTPARDPNLPARMFTIRSFDVNYPGTEPENLQGGVLGGTLKQGRLTVGEEIEINPGLETGGRWTPLHTKIASLHAEKTSLQEAGPGGLIGVGTLLDPSLTKADRLAGSIVGEVGKLPPTVQSLELEMHLMERVVGTAEEQKSSPLSPSEMIVLTIGTSTCLGTLTKLRGERVEVRLKTPVCVEQGERVAISRRVGGRWRLAGHGIVLS